MGSWLRADIINCVIYIILFLIVLVWETGRAIKQRKMRMRMTKRINVVIAERRQGKGYSEGPFHRYGYVFTGLDEYEGVTFCDETLLLEYVHVEGETVSFQVNPENPEEFLFEEEDEPGKGLLVLAVVTIFLSLVIMAQTIRNWEILPSGLETRFVTIAFVIGLIIFLIVCVRATIKVSRYKDMKRRMTKRINVVIANRWAPSQYSDDILSEYRYRYIFKGLDEYDGVIFEDSSLRVKKKHEEGEIVSLLVNEFNPEEFWFEEADEPGKLASRLWIFFVLSLFSLLPVLSWIIMEEWDVLPWL